MCMHKRQGTLNFFRIFFTDITKAIVKNDSSKNTFPEYKTAYNAVGGITQYIQLVSEYSLYLYLL